MKTTKCIIVAFLFTLAVPKIAVANECMLLWIERNSIFDRNGYCFNSDLGRGYFNNSDCYTSSPSLSSSENSRMSDIQARESRLGCASQKSSWSVSMLRNARAAPAAPAPAPPSRSCRRDVEFYFDIGGRWDMARDLSVSGPWFVSTYSTGQQAFITANNGECVGGSYSYRYVVEVDDLGENPVYVFTGGFSIGDHIRRCEISITEYNGATNLFCE